MLVLAACCAAALVGLAAYGRSAATVSAFVGSPQADAQAAGQAPRRALSRGDVLRGPLLPLGLSLLLPGAAGAEATAKQAVSVVRGDTVALNNGMKFPVASFGLQVYNDQTAKRLTETAIQVGFRNFFSSVLARNQIGFAQGFAAAGVPREEVFICGSVLSNQARGFDEAYRVTKQGCDDNLKAFASGGIKYVDMIMLDYPAGDCDSIKGQWKAFEEMLKAGTTKSLAVSNFSPEQLDCLLSIKGATVPTVNQLPFSLGRYDKNAIAENRKRGVVVQAWSPLSSRSFRAQGACEKIGKDYGKSWAQVLLRWLYQSGATYSMETKSKQHFEEDLNIFDFQLSAADMDTLNSV